MSRSYALLFPGQGAQFPGMAERWHDESSAVRDLFARAAERTGLDLQRLCFSTQRGEQARTDWTQPSVFVASLAGWLGFREFLARRGRPYDPQCVAGHSLGHFTALVAAGVIELDVAIDLVHRRGQIMQAAGGAHPGGMATILGLDLTTVSAIIADHGGPLLTVAAVNGPDQIVVSGDRIALDRVMAEAEQAGAERVIRLAIGIAAHSPLMAGARDEFGAELADLTLDEPAVPVALNTTGRLTRDLVEIRADLLLQMTEPVRWWDSVRSIHESGTVFFVDVGPGRTLSKVLRRDLPESDVVANDQPHGPEALLS